jgi:rhamnosyl/mannosyltransferase
LQVVHLGKHYPPSLGGIESHTQVLARAQAELGADVRVVVVNHATDTGRDATFERYTTTPWVEDVDQAVRVTRVGRLANVAKLDVAPGLSELLRKLGRERPDVWHLHTPNITMMLAVLANRRIRPLVITHHSDIARPGMLKHLVRPIEVAAYRRAVRILPTSPAYADGSEFLRRFGDRVTPVPLGIDLTPFTAPSSTALAHAAEFRERYGAPLWVCVGRLIYYKGLNIALEALRTVPGKLLMVGTGPLEAELKAKAEALGVADRVAWVGRASPDAVVGALLAATALWFPSVGRAEGFGLVQVEAMAVACPVVNTAVPASGVAWVCRHEQEGLTVPVGDAAAFAAAANRLLTEPGLRDRLGAAGRERAVAEFDHAVMARRTVDVYEDVIRSRGRTAPAGSAGPATAGPAGSGVPQRW